MPGVPSRSISDGDLLSCSRRNRGTALLLPVRKERFRRRIPTVLHSTTTLRNVRRSPSRRTRFTLLAGALTALALTGGEENGIRGKLVRQLRFVACERDSTIQSLYTPTVCRAASAPARSGSPLQLRPHTAPRGGSCRPNLDGKHGN